MCVVGGRMIQERGCHAKATRLVDLVDFFLARGGGGGAADAEAREEANISTTSSMDLVAVSGMEV